MNLSAIKAVCHGGKRATIYRSMHGGGQWISNGFAAYRVRGIEINSEEALMELWNLSDKARNKAIIRENITSDARFRPTVADEEELELLGSLGMAEEGQYVGLYSSAGVLWIEAQWLRPLKLDYARYFARWAGGRPLIAVYEDLEGAEALILPVTDMMGDTLTTTAVRMANRAFHWLDEDEEAAKAEAEAEAKIRDAEKGQDEGGDGA